MIQALINSLLLLSCCGISFGALFWKSFAKTPGEAARAIIATIIATIGLALFYLNVFLITANTNENIITLIRELLT